MKYKTTIDLIHHIYIHIYYLFDTITFGPKSFSINQSSFSLHSVKYNTMATLGINIKETNLLFLTQQGYI